MYEQPKWERIVASTQAGFRVRIWVRIRIRVWIRVRVRIRVMVTVRFRLGLYFGCSYIEKGPVNVIRFAIRFAICNSILSCVCIKLSLMCLHSLMFTSSPDKIQEHGQNK